MNRTRTREITLSRAAGLLFSTLLPFAGCGLALEDGSESHFAKCTVDSDCVTRGQVCVAGHCQETRDASTLPSSALPDASLCALNDNLEHVSNLASFCEVLAAQGSGIAFQCPKDRDDLLGTIPAWCGPSAISSPRGYPQFLRGCGFDVIVTDPYAPTEFYFDSTTGALLGASLQLFPLMFGCNDYVSLWRVGEEAPACARASASCDLCVIGESGCPSGITDKIPTTPCTSASDAGACSCPIAYSSSDLPANGTPCEGSGFCPSCSSQGNQTCTSTCVCMRDGVFRYRMACQ